MMTQDKYKLLAQRIARGEIRIPERTEVTQEKSTAKRILEQKRKERMTATY